jgi:hypothetical protein
MITYYTNHFNRQGFIGILAILVFLTAKSENVFSHPPPPPRPISVYVNPAQGLIFGAFYQGNSGGTITVFPDGSRSVTGDVIQANLGYLFSPAIYEVNANLGTIITIMNGPDINLTGTNGGFMKLHVGTSSLKSPFTSKVDYTGQTEVRIGGTLTVGSPQTNPPGSYNGYFSIIFMQQ